MPQKNHETKMLSITWEFICCSNSAVQQRNWKSLWTIKRKGCSCRWYFSIQVSSDGSIAALVGTVNARHCIVLPQGETKKRFVTTFNTHAEIYWKRQLYSLAHQTDENICNCKLVKWKLREIRTTTNDRCESAVWRRVCVEMFYCKKTKHNNVKR